MALAYFFYRSDSPAFVGSAGLSPARLERGNARRSRSTARLLEVKRGRDQLIELAADLVAWWIVVGAAVEWVVF